jgi:hypothetical protein
MSSVADLLAQMAQNAGRPRPSIVGGVIGEVSQIPGQIMAARQQAALAQQQQARQRWQDGRVMRDDARQEAGDVAATARQAAVNKVLMAASGDGTDPYAFDAQLGFAAAQELGDPSLIRDAIAVHQKIARPEPKPAEPFTLGTGQIRYGGDGAELARGPENVPKPAAPPSVGSFEDYVGRGAQALGKPVSALTTADIEGFRKKYQQADDRPRITVNTGNPSDVKEAVAGMKDGTLPPQMPGRASKDYTAILAESRRQGFDLGKANLDWNATQKHVATMNGAQQLRLNQAINALPDMLDSVDSLASKWKGGRFPVLNKANLALAKGGAYGSDVASIANQLDAQIADVTADLGNVYMGGNSPTDHALGLAGKSLKGEWDEKVLHDMVKLAKTNVTIRQNSIKNTGVAGASEGNPYAAPAATVAAPSGMMRVVGPNGETGSMPSGNALPPGWKKQ